MARVLLLEDDRALNRMMNTILTSAKHEVLPILDGAGALDLLASNPDLIVLDLLLPSLDGSTFLAEAVSRGYGGKVLVVSGADDGRELARMMGAEGFLAKPFEPEDLEIAVKKTLAT